MTADFSARRRNISITTLKITTLRTKTLSKKTPSIVAFRMIFKIRNLTHYADLCYPQRCYADCRGTFCQGPILLILFTDVIYTQAF
jgi:hypothetical protein